MADNKKPLYDDISDPDYEPSSAKKARGKKDKTKSKHKAADEPGEQEDLEVMQASKGDETQETKGGNEDSSESDEEEMAPKFPKSLEDEVAERMAKMTDAEMEKYREEFERKGKALSQKEKEALKEKEEVMWAEDTAEVGLSGLTTSEVVKAAMYSQWFQLVPDPLCKKSDKGEGSKDWFDVAAEAGILDDADVEIVGEEPGHPVTVKTEPVEDTSERVTGGDKATDSGEADVEVDEEMTAHTTKTNVLSALRYWRQGLQIEQDSLRRIEEAVRGTPIDGLAQVISSVLAAGPKGALGQPTVKQEQTGPDDAVEGGAETTDPGEPVEVYHFVTEPVFPVAVKKESGHGYTYKCSFCNVMKGSMNGARAHIARYHKNALLRCTAQNCNYSTYNRDGLVQHKRKYKHE